MALPTGAYQGQDLANWQAGNKFLPREYYSLKPYTVPTTEEEQVTETFGIPYTNAFTGGGGGGGGGTGTPYDLRGGFQETVDARQERLTNPNKLSQFANQALGYIGIDPQRSYEDMIKSRLTDERRLAKIPFGIGALIAKGLPDRYYDMSLADQAFTQANMGYTGPTVFGDNASGLSKDVYGINTRSMLGNYGDYVDKMVAGYEDMTEDDYENLSKFNKAKVDFYRGKKKERDQIQKDALASQMAADQAYGAKGMSDPHDRSRSGASGRRPGSGSGPTTQDTAATQGHSPGDPGAGTGGYSYDSGGREGYGYGLKYGGLARLL